MAVTFEQARPADYLTRLAASDLGRGYKALVVAELEIDPGQRVIDLGCGPGADLPAFADAVGSAGFVTGVDSHDAAVAQARALTADRGNVAVVLGDIHDLAVTDACAERVHTDRMLQHVADPARVLREVRRRSWNRMAAIATTGFQDRRMPEVRASGRIRRWISCSSPSPSSS